MRFQFFSAVKISRLLWCTSVSEEPVAYLICSEDGGDGFSETLVTTYKSIRRHDPGGLNPNIERKR
jgi:hypothetical protein